jgi:hypothetical protein
MDNVQKRDICTNVPSSQTFTSNWKRNSKEKQIKEKRTENDPWIVLELACWWSISFTAAYSCDTVHFGWRMREEKGRVSPPSLTLLSSGSALWTCFCPVSPWTLLLSAEEQKSFGVVESHIRLLLTKFDIGGFHYLGINFRVHGSEKSAACELSRILTPSINCSLLLKGCDRNQFFS